MRYCFRFHTPTQLDVAIAFARVWVLESGLVMCVRDSGRVDDGLVLRIGYVRFDLGQNKYGLAKEGIKQIKGQALSYSTPDRTPKRF